MGQAFLELSTQPEFRHRPVAFDRADGHAKGLGCFLDAQAPEVAHFHHLAFSRIDRRQSVERVIEGEHVGRRPAVPTRSSSNVTCCAPAPRFWYPRARAQSTSTRRITREDMAKKWARSCHCTCRISMSLR